MRSRKLYGGKFMTISVVATTLLEILKPLHDERLPYWKLNKAHLEEYMRKTSTSNKHKTPWFNDDCRKAIRLRNAALRKFNKQPTITNL